jgi:hypothetical protein
MNNNNVKMLGWGLCAVVLSTAECPWPQDVPSDEFRTLSWNTNVSKVLQIYRINCGRICSAI